MTPSQFSALAKITRNFAKWKRSPFTITADWFGEPYSNGARCVQVSWQYDQGSIYLDGAALVLVGKRGACKVIHAHDGLSQSQALIERVTIMACL